MCLLSLMTTDCAFFEQENFCFICGISRREFEMSTHTDFETHTKQVKKLNDVLHCTHPYIHTFDHTPLTK